MQLLIVLYLPLFLLCGCSTVNITNNIIGDSNTVIDRGEVTSPKEISTAGSAYGDANTKGAIR